MGWVRARSGLEEQAALSDVRSAWPALHGAQIEFVGFVFSLGSNPKSTVIVIELTRSMYVYVHLYCSFVAMRLGQFRAGARNPDNIAVF